MSAEHTINAPCSAASARFARTPILNIEIYEGEQVKLLAGFTQNVTVKKFNSPSHVRRERLLRQVANVRVLRKQGAGLGLHGAELRDVQGSTLNRDAPFCQRTDGGLGDGAV